MRAVTQARAGALILLGIGALAAVASSTLGIGSPADPGPGLWPVIVALAMVTFAICMLLRPDETAVEPFSREGLIVVGAAVSLVIYTWLFQRIGFETPTVLLLIVWLRGFGRDGWRITISVAVGATVVVYLLFIVGLGVSLPHLIVL